MTRGDSNRRCTTPGCLAREIRGAVHLLKSG
jgi:hypothetical protein